MKEFEKDKVKQGLRDVGFQEGRIFDRALLDQAEQELKRQYLTRALYGVGDHDDRYAARAQPRRNQLQHHRRRSGEDQANQHRRQQGVSRGRAARGHAAAHPGHVLGWFSKNDQYSRQKLAGDLESLRSLLPEQRLHGVQHRVDPGLDHARPPRHLHHGQRHRGREIPGHRGEVRGRPARARSPSCARWSRSSPARRSPGRSSPSRARRSPSGSGSEGYAFANVNANPDIDKEKRTVKFTFLIDPGRRVYVRRINVTGNARTRDEVVRREMRQLEGAFFDSQKLQLSKQRIDKTGYFSEVEVETPAVRARPTRSTSTFA